MIKQIILYDGKVEIYYNYIDTKRPDADEHQAFLFYSETFSKTYSYEQFNVNIQNFDKHAIEIKMQVDLYI